MFDVQSRQVAMSTMSTHGGLYSYYSWLVPDCGPPDSSALEPFHLHGGQTISRHSAETRTHSSRLGWNEYEGTSPWCCHGATQRVLALLSPALLHIMHFFSSRWRWYRCSEMCYSRNLVHGEKIFHSLIRINLFQASFHFQSPLQEVGLPQKSVSRKGLYELSCA